MKTGEVDWEKMRENPESARESIASGIKMTLEKAHKEGIIDAYAMMAMRMNSEADDGQSWTGELYRWCHAAPASFDARLHRRTVQ